MIDEAFLRRLGFRDFVHLRKEERDSFRRLITVKIVEGQWFTIQLVNSRGYWELEKIIFDGDRKVFDTYFSSDPSLQDIISKLFSYESNP